MTATVLHLPEGGDSGALHCQRTRKFDSSTRLDLIKGKRTPDGEGSQWTLVAEGGRGLNPDLAVEN